MTKLKEPFLSFWTNQHPSPTHSLKTNLTEHDETDPYYLLKKSDPATGKKKRRLKKRSLKKCWFFTFSVTLKLTTNEVLVVGA